MLVSYCFIILNSRENLITTKCKEMAPRIIFSEQDSMMLKKDRNFELRQADIIIYAYT